MDDQVVDTADLRMSENRLFYIMDKIGVGRRPEQGRKAVARRRISGIEDKTSDSHAAPAVDIDVKYRAYDNTDRDCRGRNCVCQTVHRRGAHRRGIDPAGKGAVKITHP